MNKKSQSIYLSLGAVAASFLLVACGNKADPAGIPSANAASAPAGGRATGAPISVTTVIAKQRSFDVSLEAIGTVTPLSSVDVKPQINSVVTQVHVKEGQFVKAGELLFTLDARPDVANVAKVRAQMVKDQAVLDDAQRQLTRSRDLLAKSFISQGALDTAQAQVDSQQANLVADRAALDAAQLALSYNSVRASGAGRLGAVNVYPGTAVQANVTPLVTITQLDPINIGFSLPQSNLGAALEGLRSGGAAVIATLPDAKTSLKGRLQFVDNAVDAATGTVKVKARFDNADGKLWPGAFVNVALNSQTLQDAVVIPTTAIIQSARGPIVYIVDKGTAALRPVKVVASQGEDSAVTGIAAGNKVVVEGRQNLRPDAAVVDRTSGPAAAPARAAASATP
ncbi:MAG: efflux RND transporter periplasmic adaptor subunit [Rhodoferax sp.]